MNCDKKHDDQERLHASREKLHSLLLREEAIKVDIAKTKREIAALFYLVNGDEEAYEENLNLNVGGLTDAVRMILRASGDQGIAPTAIRDALKALGFSIGEYRNILASIYTVLGRLIESGEVKRSKDKSLYFWSHGESISTKAEKLVRLKERNRQ